MVILRALTLHETPDEFLGRLENENAEKVKLLMKIVESEPASQEKCPDCTDVAVQKHINEEKHYYLVYFEDDEVTARISFTEIEKLKKAVS